MKLRSKWYVPALIVIASSLYAITLGHGFVWDDTIYTVGNRAYQEFDLEKIFFSLANGVEYLPLRDLTYALDLLVWRNTPLGFHLSNVILFLCNVVLIFTLTRELPFASDDDESREFNAFLTALLFSVHPLLSESVNFITCRNVLLSGAFFFMGALIFVRYLHADRQGTFPASLAVSACMLGALLSKATSITLPLVLLLLARYIPSRKNVRQLSFCIAPTFLLAVLFVPIYKQIAERSMIINPPSDALLSERVATALQIPFFYLKKIFIPTGYSAEYAADGFSQILVSPDVLMSVVALLVFAAAAFAIRRRAPVIGFSLLWFVITLLPVSNIFATYPVVADRYAFLPMFALALSTASTLTRYRIRFPLPVTGVATLLALGLGSVTFARSLDWRSDVSLWQANIKTEPANAKGYQNLVAEMIIAGDLSRAQQILAEGRAMAPSPTYDYLEGRIHYMRQDLVAALRAFEAAVQQDNDHIRSLLAMGMIYQELGNQDRAVEYYRRTLEAKSTDGWGCRNQARAKLNALGLSTESNGNRLE